jgi:hypothetical protein
LTNWTNKRQQRHLRSLSPHSINSSTPRPSKSTEIMASLTPEHRSDEVTGAAMKEGLLNGGIVLVPCLAGLYLAMRNPKFQKVRRLLERKTEQFLLCVCSDEGTILSYLLFFVHRLNSPPFFIFFFLASLAG